MTDTVISSASVIFEVIPDLRPPPVELRGRLQLVVDLHVQCGGDGVQIDVHAASMVIVAQQRRSWTPSLLFVDPCPLE
jgi:hypothetical protein